MKRVLAFAFLFVASVSDAQIFNRGVIVKDESSQLGLARTVAFVGSTVSCGISGGEATCTFTAPTVTITSASTDWSGCSNGGLLYAGYTAANKILCNKSTVNDSSGAITLPSVAIPLLFPAGAVAQFSLASYVGASDYIFTGGSAGDVGVRGAAAVWFGVGNNPMQKFNSGGIAAMNFDRTLTAAATTGAQTINKLQGSVNLAAAATTLVVTNSLAATTSLIFLTPQTADATCTAFSAVRAAGSFTITANAACTAETAVAFKVTN